MNDGRRRRPQKHQNLHSYLIKYDTLALQHRKKVPLNYLCQRCLEQLNWKLQFNKYKKISEPGKCNYCMMKCVVRSYMKCCDPCAKREDVCAKCLEKNGEEVQKLQPKSHKQQEKNDIKQQKQMNQFIDSLKQRSKHKIKRQYQKGTILWNQQKSLFVDSLGNQLTGLKFKSKGMQDLDKEMGEVQEEESIYGNQDGRILDEERETSNGKYEDKYNSKKEEGNNDKHDKNGEKKKENKSDNNSNENQNQDSNQSDDEQWEETSQSQKIENVEHEPNDQVNNHQQ